MIASSTTSRVRLQQKESQEACTTYNWWLGCVLSLDVPRLSSPIYLDLDWYWKVRWRVTGWNGGLAREFANRDTAAVVIAGEARAISATAKASPVARVMGNQVVAQAVDEGGVERNEDGAE